MILSILQPLPIGAFGDTGSMLFFDNYTMPVTLKPQRQIGLEAKILASASALPWP